MTKSSLILVGDTNLRNCTSSSRPFQAIQATLDSSDVRFCNSEGCFSDPTVELPYKSGWYHTDPAASDVLAFSGFDAVGVASNVTYGAEAILESLSHLDRHGIAHTGSGQNIDAARRPAIVEKAGTRFGFLAYTSVFQPYGHAAGPSSPGVATIKAHTSYRPHRRALEMPGVPPDVMTWASAKELDAARIDVTSLKGMVDVLVVSCHWGVSGSHETLDYQREIAEAVVEAGADVVIGHHPHVVQGVEIIRGRPVFYSLGNFVFGWEKMQSRHRAGLLIECGIAGGRLNAVSVRPVWRDDEGGAFLVSQDSEEGELISGQLRSLSACFSTRMTPEGDRIRIEL